MDFSKVKTKDLVEIYGQIDTFLSFLEKQKESIKVEEKEG